MTGGFGDMTGLCLMMVSAASVNRDTSLSLLKHNFDDDEETGAAASEAETQNKMGYCTRNMLINMSLKLASIKRVNTTYHIKLDKRSKFTGDRS